MPTYEYECKECDHHFEVFQSMSDEPIKICPECGKEVRRLIFGGVGVIFKGPGFYVTDRAAAKSSGSIKGKADAAAATPSDAAGVSKEGGAVAGGDAAKGDSPKKEADSKGGAEHGKAANSGTQKKNKPAAQTA